MVSLTSKDIRVHRFPKDEKAQSLINTVDIVD